MSGAMVFLYVQLDFTISEQEEHLNMRKSETYRNEIKSYIVRTGMTMTEVVDYLSTTSPMNTAGAAASPISPANSSAVRSATARRWNLRMRWGMTSCGKKDVKVSGRKQQKQRISL